MSKNKKRNRRSKTLKKASVNYEKHTLKKSKVCFSNIAEDVIIMLPIKVK